jgi:hypothetical protein
MSLLKRFIIVNVLLITGLVVYLSYLSQNSKLDSKGLEKNEVLAASTENFDVFAPATINQYPVISYPDGKTVPFQDRFAVIRKYSSPTKFTNHLCNAVNEASAAWKNDTQGCAGYTPNPTFVKLNFDGGEKLMLYGYYGLHAIDSGNNTVKWQSAHIDRIQNASAVYGCGWTYDPSSVIPVKSGSNFYLFSKFSGLNNANCLQFYDKEAAKPSFSQSTGRLYLGYEVSTSGELNTNSYTRTTVAPYINPAIGGPFGPGPKNATLYASAPYSDIYGCSAFDSSKRCVSIGGVSELIKPVASAGTVSNGKCLAGYNQFVEGWIRCAFCTAEIPGWGRHTTTVCASTSGVNPKCGDGTLSGTYAVRNPSGDYTKYVCTSYQKIVSNASFKGSIVSPTFNNFGNFALNAKSWSTTNSSIPSDYPPYSDEVSVNSTSNALNFTKDLNSKVFTSDKFMYKVSILSGKLNVQRYSLNTSTYTPGSTSYIQASSLSTILNLGNTANTKYSLQYYSNDIYLLAAGTTTFKFYRIENLNTTGATVTAYDLSAEITSKITTGTPKAFGIVSGKIYVIVGNQVFYSTVKGTGGTIVSDLNYGNFEVNGNVYTRTDLTEKFIVTNPSKKLEGNFITEASTVSTNIKSVKEATFSFDYPTSLPKTIDNFTAYSTSLNKFNLLIGPSTADDPNPLAASSYVSIPTTSINKYELVYISQNRGVKIDLKNTNLNNVNFKLDKYIFVNLDKGNNSRINFTVDCTNAAYSVICTAGNKFYMKGALLGQFTITGNILSSMTTSRFINVSENPELILNIAKDLRSKKYPLVTTSKINLKYSQ